MKNILLIESDEISRLLMKELMIFKEVHFIECTNGKEAIARLNEFKLSAIFLNTRLSDYDGWELLRMIKEIEPQIPVIGLSAENPNISEARKTKVKFDKYFGLPLNLPEFLNGIRIYCS